MKKTENKEKSYTYDNFRKKFLPVSVKEKKKKFADYPSNFGTELAVSSLKKVKKILNS